MGRGIMYNISKEKAMKKNTILIVVLTILAAACSNKSTGNFQIYMKDAPQNFEQILVTMTYIYVHHTGGADIAVLRIPKVIDLIQLKGRQEFIVDQDLDAGKYTEIRLIINAGSVVAGGVTYTCEVPSTEIKIPVQFDILKDQTTKIILDFDAENSIEIHPIGGGQNKYILRPVINVDNISY
jgi:hypothetical protein